MIIDKANGGVLGHIFFLEKPEPKPFALSFYLRNTRPPSTTFILEICSGRRRPNLRSGLRCLMAERMSRESSRLHNEGTLPPRKFKNFLLEKEY